MEVFWWNKWILFCFQTSKTNWSYYNKLALIGIEVKAATNIAQKTREHLTNLQPIEANLKLIHL